jgi:predicted phosphoribosyltransferase
MFINRLDGAIQLVLKLKKYKGKDGIVLAIPRGGVPVGYVIAKELMFPLEVMLTKKIGHPFNSEYAIGSVSMDGTIVINNITGVSEKYIQEKSEELKKSLKEKFAFFMGDRKPQSLKNKVVILVDDGIATGSTMIASIQSIRTQQPKSLIVAVPVAPPDTAEKIKLLVDEFVALSLPHNFQAVGQFYEDFPQVSDEEVIELLKK